MVLKQPIMKNNYILLMLLLVSCFGWQASAQIVGGTTCANALEVTPGVYNDVFIVSDSGGASQNADNALWYSYTPVANGTININSCISDPSPVDTRLFVYTDGCDILTLVDNDDDGCDAPNEFGSSIEEINVIGGQEYLIEWDDRWENTTPFDWELTYTCVSFIIAPNNLNIDPDPSSCVAANVDLGEPTTNGGACGIQTISNDAPSEFPIGLTQVIWTLVDGSGIETTDTQTVTVIFNDPIITAPNNLNIDPDPSSCVAANVDLGTPNITGGCGIQTISNNAPNEFAIGTTQVLWTLIDGSGIEITDTQTVTVIFNDPIITAPNNLNIDPDPSSCVAANVDLGTPNITGGCGIQTISNNAPNEFAIGTTQVLWTLIDGSGIETTDTQTVTVTLQVDVADLCYVSSDQTQITNNRIFITNDPANSGLNVAYYEVLRESQSGAYESIGFITPPEVSFLDIESNNASQAYRYKIRTTDVCGANYPESSFHKTILLQSGIASDNSINLSWTPYLGLDFSTYNIFKNTNGTGYELLTSLSFNNTTYNDTSANVVDNFYEYYISIDVASCGSDPLLPFSLRSNLELVNPNLSITNTNWLNQEIQIYPNPTSDYINISFPNQIEITTVSIYNALGQLVFDTNKFENIYISNLTTGLYYLSINTNQGVVNKTMIRE